MKKDTGHRLLKELTLVTSSLSGRLSAAQTYCYMKGALQVLPPFVFCNFETPL